jgi:hypothetical protein
MCRKCRPTGREEFFDIAYVLAAEFVSGSGR